MTDLVGRQEQVLQLAAVIAIADSKLLMVQTVLDVQHAAPMIHRHIEHVQIPRDGCPQVCFGIMVIVDIPSLTQIAVVDRTVDRSETVIVLQVKILFPPRCRVRLVISVSKRRQVGSVIRLCRTLVLLVPAAFHLVGIAVGQPVFVEESPVGILDRQVKPPQVAFILIGRTGFDRCVNNPKLKGVGFWRGHTGHVIQRKCRRLVDSGHAAMGRHPGHGAGPHVHDSPAAVVLLAVIVPGLEVMATREEELPLILARHVGRPFAADFVFYVVIHYPIVNQSAAEARVLIAAVILAVDHIRFACDEMICRQKPHHFATECDDFRPGRIAASRL